MIQYQIIGIIVTLAVFWCWWVKLDFYTDSSPAHLRLPAHWRFYRTVRCRAVRPHCIIFYKWSCYCFHPLQPQLPSAALGPWFSAVLCNTKNRVRSAVVELQHCAEKSVVWPQCCVSCAQASPRCWPCPPSLREWTPPCPECPTSRLWTFISGSASCLSSCLCWSTQLSTTCPPSRTAESARWGRGRGLRLVSVAWLNSRSHRFLLSEWRRPNRSLL